MLLSPARSGVMQLIDVTVPLGPHLPVYPGNTPFSLEPVKRIASGGGSNVSSLRMSVHTGTHVDAPRHFFDEGATVEVLVPSEDTISVRVRTSAPAFLVLAGVVSDLSDC